MAIDLVDSNSRISTIQVKTYYNSALSKRQERDVYSGIVLNKETYSLDDIARRMVAEGCAANKETTRAVLAQFANLCATLLCEGRSVVLDRVLRLRCTFKGTLDQADAPFTDKNYVSVSATVLKSVKQLVKTAPVTRVNTIVLPKLSQVISMALQKSNVITSEGSFMVVGELLTWDNAAEDEGFFLNAGGEEEKCTPVESTQDPKCSILRTDMIFETAGLPLELFFRTRIDGNLYQVKYDQTLVTALSD